MIQLRLYDPKENTLRPVTLEAEPVSLYVCGITPYDTTHLGHAFTYAVADHLVRLLEFTGHTVRYVQNVTDIDDDILRKAGEVDEDWRTLGDRWTTHFLQDMQRLNMRAPDYYPRASAFIPQMIEGIEKLIACGHAYCANGSVYYAAQSWNRFGKLSGIAADELQAVADARGNRADDPNKRDPLDFPLWQAQQPGEPAWDSPWGPGRPGWHIECSTMATSLLGQQVDFHGGGSDLAFPHHECEIAQAESITGTGPYVRHWFHAAMVEYDGEKMSKSLGNLIMVRDLLEEVPPDAVRMYLAAHHYRTPWSYDPQTLAQRAVQAQRWSATATAKGGDGANYRLPESVAKDFIAALDDDLNTPEALRILDAAVDALHKAAHNGCHIAPAQAEFIGLAEVLGLRLVAPIPHPLVMEGWRRHLQEFEAIQRQ